MTNFSTRSHTARTRLLTTMVAIAATFLATAAVMLTAPEPAAAGTFIVYSCDAAPWAPNTAGAPRADDAWRYAEGDWYGVFEGGQSCGSGARPSWNSNCYGARAVNQGAGQHATWSAGWFYPGCTQRPGDKNTAPGMTSYGGAWTRSVNRNFVTPKSQGSMQVFTTPPNTDVLRLRVKDYLRREGNVMSCGEPIREKCPAYWTVGWIAYTNGPGGTYRDGNGIEWGRGAYPLRGCWNASQFCQIEGTSDWMNVTPAWLQWQWGIPSAAINGYPVERLQLNTTCGEERVGWDGATFVRRGGGCPTPYWDVQGHGYFMQVEVRDNVLPRISLNPYNEAAGDSELASGTALKPGVHDVDYNVEDNVGVKQTALYINGVYWNQKTYPCDYTTRSPCADRVGVAWTGRKEKLEANTSWLPEGWHRSEVVGFDAAGNMAVATVGAVTPRSIGGWFYADNSAQLPVANCDANLGPVDEECNNANDNDPGDSPPADNIAPGPGGSGPISADPAAGTSPIFTYGLLRNNRPTQRPVRPNDDCREVGPVPGPLSDHDAKQVVTVHIDLRSYFPDRRGMGEQTLKDSFSLRSRLNREYLYAMGCAY